MLGGMETADLPQLLKPQLCHHGGICLGVSCHPCQPPCKGIMSGVWIFMDVGSDFQTPGLPCSGGEQHVLVPEVAEVCLDNLVWSSSDFPVCEQAGKHFHSSSWYFSDFVMPGIGYEIPISLSWHTQLCSQPCCWCWWYLGKIVASGKPLLI